MSAPWTRAESPLRAFALPGRTAVVTGAASGIGRATAVCFAGAGARVVLADLDEAGLEQTAALLPSGGHDALCVRTDVSQRGDVVALVERAVAAAGRLDVMANVAGILSEAPVEQVEEEALERVLAVNLRGTFFGCQAAAAVMTPQGSGSILNVASSAAFRAFANFSAYAMSKAGVVALTRVLAAELGPRGVRVNAVAPGMVATPMAFRKARRPDGSFDAQEQEAVVAAARRRSPLGLEGRPEDVALALLYLASDAARYVTGQVLHANGGSHMP